MSMDPQTLGWLENQYEEALEEYHRLLTENLEAMKIVELDEDEFLDQSLCQMLIFLNLKIYNFS